MNRNARSFFHSLSAIGLPSASMRSKQNDSENSLPLVRRSFAVIALAVAGLYAVTGIAQDRFADVQVTAEQVRGNIYMLTGAGGNIGVSVGEDGLLIIDDQYAPMAEKIETALAGLAPDTHVKYIINTHHHGDHTGSNSYFNGNHDATILAHHNVRVRLLADEETPKAKLPVITYDNGISMHFNGDMLEVTHFTGHTDGDSVIYFKDANVLHTGDLFFNGRFPYIDLKSGGNVESYLAAIDAMLAMTNEDTKIIPGHGPLATPEDYRALRGMIAATYGEVTAALAAGKSQEEIVAMGVAPEYAKYTWAFINEDKWLQILTAAASAD